MKFNKVAIIGVGEIGGSIGKAIREKKLAREVIGISRRLSSLKNAMKSRAIDKFFLLEKIKEGVSGADLIILATPILKIVELGKEAIFYAKKGAIITDVGSTKKSIVCELEKHMPGKVKFIGSHPMAGSEKGGCLNSDPRLFENHDCFITKTVNTDKNALKILKNFWKNLGANPIEITVDEHDRIVGNISQMVHIAASSLVIANKDILKYAASGFRDTTRVALSDPEIWKDICITNNKNISEALGDLINILKKFKKAISGKDVSTIYSMLKKARALRKLL